MNIKKKFKGINVLTSYVYGYIAVLYLPVLMIPLFSLSDSTYVSFPLKEFTLRWYLKLWDNAPLHSAFANSLRVALCASLVATLCGTLTAFAITRRPNLQASVSSKLALVPLTMPGIVVGVSVLMVFNLLTIGPSLIAVTIGHIVIALPLVVMVMKGRFLSYPRSMEEAAYDLGANVWQTLFRISLPIVLPGIISSLLLAFTLSFDEFIVSFFLVGTDQTLPLFIWSQLRFSSKLPEILALGSIILTGSIALVVCSELILKKHKSVRV